MDERLRQIVAATLAVDLEVIDDSASQETLAAWTSLAHLQLITQIESEFSVSFGMDEVLELTSLAKIAARLATGGLVRM